MTKIPVCHNCSEAIIVNDVLYKNSNTKNLETFCSNNCVLEHFNMGSFKHTNSKTKHKSLKPISKNKTTYKGHEGCLKLIEDITYDYDNCKSVETLKDLIDEVRVEAANALTLGETYEK